MDLGQLARILSVSAQAEAAEPATDYSPKEVPKQKPASAWEGHLATVTNSDADLRLRKGSWRKMVGTVNRMFPIAAQARNRDDLIADLSGKVATLAKVRKENIEVVDQRNLADGMLQAMRKPSTIPQYVHDRINGHVDARLTVDKQAGALRLAAAVTLQAFGIKTEGQLRTAVEKMRSLETVQASASARALLALATVSMGASKPGTNDLQEFVMSFYLPALGDTDATVRTYECAMAMLADAPPRKRS